MKIKIYLLFLSICCISLASDKKNQSDPLEDPNTRTHVISLSNGNFLYALYNSKDKIINLQLRRTNGSVEEINQSQAHEILDHEIALTEKRLDEIRKSKPHK